MREQSLPTGGDGSENKEPRESQEIEGQTEDKNNAAANETPAQGGNPGSPFLGINNDRVLFGEEETKHPNGRSDSYAEETAQADGSQVLLKKMKQTLRGNHAIGTISLWKLWEKEVEKEQNETPHEVKKCGRGPLSGNRDNPDKTKGGSRAQDDH